MNRASQVRRLMKRFGELPESWDFVPLGDLLEERQETSSDIAQYPLNSLIIGEGIVPKDERYNRTFLLKDEEKNRYNLVYPGNFVFNPMNLRFGAIAYSRHKVPVTVSAYYTVLAPSTREFDPRYLYKLLTSYQIMDLYDVIAIGSLIEKRRVYWSDLKELVIPLPPLEVQRTIGTIIDAWDKAIALVERRIEAARQRKKGLMQRLLTGRVRFPEFTGMPWTSYRISDLLKVVERPVVWDDEDTYNLLSIKRRSEGIVFRESMKGCDIKTKQMNVTHAGDFLISKMQVVHGAWALNTSAFDVMHISSSYIALVSRDQSKLAIEFFDWLSRMPFMYHLAFLSSHGVHIEKMTFKLADFLKRKIKIPSTVDEQKKIAAVLQTCDREIELLEQKRDALQRQKKGLMQRLLTRRVRVKV